VANFQLAVKAYPVNSTAQILPMAVQFVATSINTVNFLIAPSFDTGAGLESISITSINLVVQTPGAFIPSNKGRAVFKNYSMPLVGSFPLTVGSLPFNQVFPATGKYLLNIITLGTVAAMDPDRPVFLSLPYLLTVTN
jgi:hypothetical protein